MCFMCMIGGLTANVAVSLGVSYSPSSAHDFESLQKMMVAVEAQSNSCASLQSIYQRVQKYTDSTNIERNRYMAGMAQELTKLYAPKECTVK